MAPAYVTMITMVPSVTKGAIKTKALKVGKAMLAKESIIQRVNYHGERHLPYTFNGKTPGEKFDVVQMLSINHISRPAVPNSVIRSMFVEDHDVLRVETLAADANWSVPKETTRWKKHQQKLQERSERKAAREATEETA